MPRVMAWSKRVATALRSPRPWTLWSHHQHAIKEDFTVRKEPWEGS